MSWARGRKHRRGRRRWRRWRGAEGKWRRRAAAAQAVGRGRDKRRRSEGGAEEAEKGAALCRVLKRGLPSTQMRHVSG